MSTKILITGGAGFVGSKLVPYLLKKGFEIIVIDTLWFGNYLQEHPSLNMIHADIRNIDGINLPKIDRVIHLANIANDPAVDLHPQLSWEVNVLAGYQLIKKAINCGAKQFIFASSGSVYGIKSEAKVTEELDLVPISEYNKTKMVAERVFLSFANEIRVHNIRPATVCGFSPRMRLDVAVNLLTMQALTKKEITVLGGDQTRPNIHIDDMVRTYEHFLMHPELENGDYNAGFENISIMDIAKKIQKRTGANISVLPSNDPRSYNQFSGKLLATGFKPKFDVDYAIDEIIKKFRLGMLTDDENWHTVKRMKSLNVK
jgi:nucleoside-diphosphate-sugar epimerase